MPSDSRLTSLCFLHRAHFPRWRLIDCLVGKVVGKGIQRPDARVKRFVRRHRQRVRSAWHGKGLPDALHDCDRVGRSSPAALRGDCGRAGGSSGHESALTDRSNSLSGRGPRDVCVWDGGSSAVQGLQGKRVVRRLGRVAQSRRCCRAARLCGLDRHHFWPLVALGVLALIVIDKGFPWMVSPSSLTVGVKM